MPHWPCCVNFHGLPRHLGAGLGGVVVLDRRRGTAGRRSLRQLRLGVEQVDVARPALHEQRDHRPRPRRMVRRLRRAGRTSAAPAPAWPARRAACSRFSSQARAERADAHRAASQEVPAGMTGERGGVSLPVSGCGMWHSSVDVQKRVGAPERLAEAGQGEQLGVIRLGILCRRLVFLQLCEVGCLRFEERDQLRQPLCRPAACRRPDARPAGLAICRSSPRFALHARWANSRDC